MKTKFCVFHALILCFSIGQICSESAENAYEKARKAMHEDLGFSEQFSDDFTNISQKFLNHSDVITWLARDVLHVLVSRVPKERASKIDMNQLRDFFATDDYFKILEGEQIAMEMDGLKKYQSILSKELPPEQCNGIMNLAYILHNPKATTEEIESTLNYLYGNDTSVVKTSFIDSHDFWNLTTSDCPTWTRMYSEEMDKLKSMIDIKSKVVQDFDTLHEKFPCVFRIVDLLSLITQFHCKESKINACMMKGYYEIEKNSWGFVNLYQSETKEDSEYKLKQLETLFSTKLPDETFRGILNLQRVYFSDAPNDEVEKALKYLYDDVPNAPFECVHDRKLETKN